MSLFFEKRMRKISMNGKSKVDFDIIKRNNKKITELSGVINNTGAVKIKKFKETPIIQKPSIFTLKINQIKDIMNNNTEKSKSTKKKPNVIEIKKPKSTKIKKDALKTKKPKATKSTKTIKKRTNEAEIKKPKTTKTTKTTKTAKTAKTTKTAKKSRKNNLEK